MAKQVLCPICGASYNLADEQLGKRVRCKKCEHPFTAGSKPKRRHDDSDDDGIQDAPRSKGRPRSNARRDRDRDDDDRRPRKTRSVEEQTKPRGESEPGLPVSSFVIMGVVVGILFLCCGGAGLLWLIWPSPPRQNVPNGPNQPARRVDAGPPVNLPRPPSGRPGRR